MLHWWRWELSIRYITNTMRRKAKRVTRSSKHSERVSISVVYSLSASREYAVHAVDSLGCVSTGLIIGCYSASDDWREMGRGGGGGMGGGGVGVEVVITKRNYWRQDTNGLQACGRSISSRWSCLPAVRSLPPLFLPKKVRCGGWVWGAGGEGRRKRWTIIYRWLGGKA